MGGRGTNSCIASVVGIEPSISRQNLLTCLLWVVIFLMILPRKAAAQTTQKRTTAPSPPSLVWRNTSPNVRYVGSQACGSCHSEIFNSFRQTGMGRSMLPATDSSLAGLPSPATVYDQDLGKYFEIEHRDGNWYQSEYARGADGKDIFRQTWKMDYFIGAGDNGLGFVLRRDNNLFEAPLSYYSKTRTWSFSPGYEFRNQAFTRPIVGACIGCHSGRPNPVEGQIGLYKDTAFDELAVGCENCHGPGDLHVKERTQEQMMGVAPSEAADTSIVNPSRLSGWLADNVCMRCHQGDDVRIDRPRTQERDFRPGMPLDRVISIFRIPLGPQQSPSSMLLEHYYGMTLSKCYKATAGGLHCVSCHDPHTQLTPAAAFDFYRSRCLKCHNDQSCTLSRDKRLATSPPDDCVGCHMPKRTITTITHAALTDHTIPAKPAEAVLSEAPRGTSSELLHLSAPLEQRSDIKSVPPIVLLQAYTGLVHTKHDQFVSKMDALLAQLAQTDPSDPIVLRALARQAAQRDTPEARDQAIRGMTRVIHTDSANVDDYTLLAELYVHAERNRDAIAILEKARTTYPYFSPIYESLASQYMTTGDYKNALGVLKKALELFPDDSKLRALDKEARAATLDGVTQ